MVRGMMMTMQTMISQTKVVITGMKRKMRTMRRKTQVLRAQQLLN